MRAYPELAYAGPPTADGLPHHLTDLPLALVGQLGSVNDPFLAPGLASFVDTFMGGVPTIDADGTAGPYWFSVSGASQVADAGLESGAVLLRAATAARSSSHATRPHQTT